MMERIVIKVDSQDEKENVKISRKSLKVLQQSANKENLAGRPFIDKLTSLKGNDEFKSKQTEDKGVQVGERVISAEDLMCEDPGVDYWKRLAEVREERLNRSLNENEQLKATVSALQDENNICKQMLDESRTLVEVLQEMLSDEANSSQEIAEEPESSAET